MMLIIGLVREEVMLKKILILSLSTILIITLGVLGVGVNGCGRNTADGTEFETTKGETVDPPKCGAAADSFTFEPNLSDFSYLWNPFLAEDLDSIPICVSNLTSGSDGIVDGNMDLGFKYLLFQLKTFDLATSPVVDGVVDGTLATDIEHNAIMTLSATLLDDALELAESITTMFDDGSGDGPSMDDIPAAAILIAQSFYETLVEAISCVGTVECTDIMPEGEFKLTCSMAEIDLEPFIDEALTLFAGELDENEAAIIGMFGIVIPAISGVEIDVTGNEDDCVIQDYIDTFERVSGMSIDDMMEGGGGDDFGGGDEGGGGEENDDEICVGDFDGTYTGGETGCFANITENECESTFQLNQNDYPGDYENCFWDSGMQACYYNSTACVLNGTQMFASYTYAYRGDDDGKGGYIPNKNGNGCAEDKYDLFSEVVSISYMKGKPADNGEVYSHLASEDFNQGDPVFQEMLDGGDLGDYVLSLFDNEGQDLLAHNQENEMGIVTGQCCTYCKMVASTGGLYLTCSTSPPGDPGWPDNDIDCALTYNELLP